MTATAALNSRLLTDVVDTPDALRIDVGDIRATCSEPTPRPCVGLKSAPVDLRPIRPENLPSGVDAPSVPDSVGVLRNAFVPHACGGRVPRRRLSMLAVAAAAMTLAGCMTASSTSRAALPPPVASPAADVRVVMPSSVAQGALVIGKVPVGSTVRVGTRMVRVTAYGSVVFGIGRDASSPLEVQVGLPDGSTRSIVINVTRTDWPLERINGVPPGTVNPPPALAARIEREQARVTAARLRDDARADFAQGFIQPVSGRISGRFGRARSYNGQEGGPHSGLDIAVATGTPVLAPAAGVVTLADPDLYITGGTVLLDHGHGVSSNFLHLSRIDVRVGDRVAQGQTLGAVGATGRATGPHLHWGMNWFDVRVDPQQVLARPP